MMIKDNPQMFKDGNKSFGPEQLTLNIIQRKDGLYEVFYLCIFCRRASMNLSLSRMRIRQMWKDKMK